MKLRNTRSVFANDRSEDAFTMIEVAMSLAIVAFALVAIIGVMPTGLNVQRQNADETIISQDGTYLLEAIRQGTLSANLTQLGTNLTEIDLRSEFNAVGNPSTYYWTNGVGSPPSIDQLVLHLARPRESENLSIGVATAPITNYVRLRFFALSGNMTAVLGNDSDKMQYEVQIEVIAGGSGLSDPNVFAATNQFTSSFIQGNLHTVKLTYRWPVLPTGRLGSGRKVLLTQFRGYLKPKKLTSSPGTFPAAYADVEIDDDIEAQLLDDVDPTDGINYGWVFEGTMLR